jgi:hypothetical protein
MSGLLPYVGAALHVKCLQPRRRIAERATAAIDDVLQAFFGIGFDEGSTFERSQSAADADLGKIVEQGFGGSGSIF